MRAGNRGSNLLCRAAERKRKLLPLSVLVLMGVLLALLVKRSGQPLSVNTILAYTPENEALAAAILLAFFALKSLTVVFPLSVLYLASGVLFEAPRAVLVSTLGLAIALTIPYSFGRCAGRQTVRRLRRTYPKAAKIAAYQERDPFFACFITRIVGFLPGDVVSLYFGACGVAYPVYLTAGVTGSLLSVLTTTLLGEKLSDPFSKAFALVLLCRVLVSAGAIATHRALQKRS